MSDASLRATINCTIEILLAKEPIQTRLSRADRYITELEQHRSELQDGCWEALENAVAMLTSSKDTSVANPAADDYLSPGQEFALTEELLLLDIDANGGALIV